MNRPIISLTTDFGNSHYVGQLKGVLATLAPEAMVIDITHAISPQSILEGAVILQDSIPYFPAETIHIAVVDPGVGTSRGLLAAQIGTWTFVGPDNGLFSGVAREWPIKKLVKLQERRWWRTTVSNTFHGRDIMAPVASHLAKGVPIESFGPLLKDMLRIEIPLPDVLSLATHDEVLVKGKTLFADSYGNLLTNIRERDLERLLALSPNRALQVMVTDERDSRRILCVFVSTYGESLPGQLVSLLGSSGRLELGIVNGNAAKMFPLGATVSVSC